jgi:Divergent InlB B-repeat domain/Domain of unknown function DUF11/WD40-like Beta Propeller Repeat
MRRTGVFGLAVIAATAALAAAGPANAAPPVNDDFASATVIASGGGATVTGTNVDATKEAGEPDHAGDPGGASVWYRWTPNFTGAVSIDTSGSDFDTLLAVYAGTSLGSLTLLGSDDDVDAFGSTGRVCVVAGQTLMIAVDGFAGDTGNIELTLGSENDSAPCPRLPPTITNPAAPLAGDTLHMAPGSFNNAGVASTQWYRCDGGYCNPIAGATGSSYTATDRDAGTRVMVQMSSTSGGVTANNRSAPTDIVSTTVNVGRSNGRIFWSARYSVGGTLTSATLSGFVDGRDVLDLGILGPVSVSPDGRELAYQGTGNDITVTDSSGGGQPFDSTVPGSYPTWSPDGSRIAFVAPYSVGQSPVIKVWDLDAGYYYTLSTFPTNTSVADLAWSPDGSRIAFTYADFSTPPSQYDIGVVDADGLGPITLVADSSNWELRPAWSPSSDEIAYVRGGNAAVLTGGDLWVMNADGSNQHQLYGAGPAGDVQSVSWSPDGTALVFSLANRPTPSSDLYLIGSTGGAANQLTNAVTAGETNELPVWAAGTTYRLTTTIAGTGGGRVTSAPAGISCTSTCNADFDDPTAVVLTATPNAGSTFTGWSGSCTGTGQCAVTMDGADGITATFTAAPAPPPPSSGGGGGSSGGGSSGGSSGGGAPGPYTGVYPDLKVVLTSDSPTAPAVGQPLVYHLVVSDNPHTYGASQVFVDVTLPAGYTVTSTYSDRGTGCKAAPPGLVCDLDWISPGVDGHISITGTVGQAGVQQASATVRHWLEEGYPQDNTMALTLSPLTATAPTEGATSVTLLAAPTISGKAVVGGTLTATPPRWSPAPQHASYQWQLCTGTHCVAVKGATTLALKLTKADAQKSVRLVTTATFAGGTRTSESKKVPIRKAGR